MKTLVKISILFFIIIMLNSSFLYNVPSNYKKALQVQQTCVEDFGQLNKLFEPIKLPFQSTETKISPNTIPKKYVDAFFSPNNTEINNAEQVKPIGKFITPDNYICLIINYWTGISGDVHELFVFDASGNYISSAAIGIDYGSFQLSYKIATDCTITTTETTEGSDEQIQTKYKIINGVITQL